ncbi:hypothetical protein C8J56DRAFT_1049673 [Mycena floridula]|nr:hypothetical protein C8J56DRAFT_1049673 [Mycena floridula]
MSLALSLKQCLERLKGLLITFRCSLIQLTQLQWTYLELVAVLDWVQKYQLMLQGILPVPPPLEVTETIGTFFYDDHVAQSFFRVGLPFWWVHSVTKLAHVRIDQLHNVYLPLNAPATFVTQDDATPPFLATESAPPPFATAIHVSIDPYAGMPSLADISDSDEASYDSDSDSDSDNGMPPHVDLSDSDSGYGSN